MINSSLTSLKSLVVDNQWLRRQRSSAFSVVILMAAVTAAVVGWKLFFFLTDDAHIAFRYVSNARSGWGLAWNPPPFKLVEGYTSFLWVVILKGVWELFGVEPPRSSNILSLLFGLGTLCFVWLFMLRINLPRKLERSRIPLLALVLLGTVTNRTFLTWLSSGLETALFNFLLIWWVYEGLTDPRRRSRGWVVRFTLAASLTALARPDGYLVWLATFIILVKLYLSAEKRADIHLAIPVLAAVPLHMVWRQFTYGTWLPNTYYAKSDGFWPESGLRYLGSFLLENGFWFLVILLCLVLALSVDRVKKEVRSGRKVTLSLHLLLDDKVLVLGTLLAHFSYYTFVIGGDHFEYRVYSHLIPLGFILAAWTVVRLSHRVTGVLALLLLIVVLSYPIPWTHWRETKDLTARKDTQMMVTPIAP